MKLAVAFVAAIVMALGSTPASATLINLGTITRDTDRGIDWLDPSETLGMTVSEALAAFPGWTVALDSQVCSFAYEVETVFPQCTFQPAAIGGEIAGLWDGLFTTWGLTFTNGSTLPYTGSDAVGLAGLSLIDGNTYSLHVWAVSITGGSGTGTASGATLGTPDYSHPDVGVFLVRPIPEPSTALLLAMGLGALGLRRRRQAVSAVAATVLLCGCSSANSLHRSQILHDQQRIMRLYADCLEAHATDPKAAAQCEVFKPPDIQKP